MCIRFASNLHQKSEIAPLEGAVPLPILVFTNLNENLVYSAKYCLVWFKTVKQISITPELYKFVNSNRN